MASFDPQQFRPDRRTGDVIYLLAAVASASVVAAANFYLVEPVTLTLLYAIPVGLAAYRFRYSGAAWACVASVALTVLSHSLRPGTLFFDSLVLSLALVMVVSMLVARVGTNSAVDDHGSGQDPVTGLASRRAITGALSLELVRCARYGRPVSLLLIGLDDLPGLTPYYLPKCLGEIARLLEGRIRDVDALGRFGDRELLAVLPETRKADAPILAERLRLAVERSEASPGVDASRVTASIAVAGYPEDSLSLQGLLDAAEEALFEARTLGGNRVRQARKTQATPRRG